MLERTLKHTGWISLSNSLLDPQKHDQPAPNYVKSLQRHASSASLGILALAMLFATIVLTTKDPETRLWEKMIEIIESVPDFCGNVPCMLSGP